MNRLLMIISMGLAFSLPAQATMYRWVDDKGKVHYGDTIPPEYAKQGNAQLNQSGVVVKKTNAALTQEQIKARDDAEAKEKADKATAAEQQRRDKALLATYTDFKEIDLALQRNLGQVDIQIKSNELRIKSIQGRLDGLKKQEAGFVQRKKAVPPDISSDIKKTEEEMGRFRGNIANFEKEKEGMRTRFAADKVRFRELKGLPPEAVAAPAPAPIAPPTPPVAPVKPTVPAPTPAASPAKK
ncbi:MAG: DUF4124 domain-containing protein [Hydrogenophilales bacterium]|nr:DUF4124 domain-containing protein [Hydrogenophilales bacterium]